MALNSTSLTAEMTISVIIPVYNGGESFRQCLASLARSTLPANEVIVVADGDTDGSWRIAEEHGARVLRLSTTGGPARARNCGARLARGDILLFVDADVSVAGNTICQVIAAFRKEPALAAIFGSYDDEPAASNFLSQYKNLLHHYVHQTASEEASTFWGACGAIRREVFLALDGFDERYRWPSIEDIELGYRLKQAGKRVRLCKTLQVKHLKRWEIGSLLKADFFFRALPWTALILRDRHLPNDLNLRLSGRLSVLFTYGLLGAALGGWWRLELSTVAGGCALGLLLLNAPLYHFFWCKRGWRFVLQAVPWHWLYYFYSGLAFVIGVIYYLSCGENRPTGAPTISRKEAGSEERAES